MISIEEFEEGAGHMTNAGVHMVLPFYLTPGGAPVRRIPLSKFKIGFPTSISLIKIISQKLAVGDSKSSQTDSQY